MGSLVDICRFNPTLGGTTDWTVNTAVTGFITPAQAGATNGAVYRYRAESADRLQWEIGYGVYSTGTTVLTRAIVMFNSSGTTSKINFSTVPQIAIIALAEDIGRPQSDNPNVRITASSGVPITSTDVAAVGTIYVTPYSGNIIPLYDSSNWVPTPFAETSLSLSGFAANTVFDLWGRISSGALAIDTTAWTNDTTRATAIAQQDGIDVKSGDATRRLLGTFRTTGTTGQTEDSKTKRYISNRYNDVPRMMLVNDPAATWASSGSATFRQANANAANQNDCVMCVPRFVQIMALGNAYLSVVNTPSLAMVGIGISSIPVASADILHCVAGLSSGVGVACHAYYAGTPGAGRFYFTWMESVTPTGTSVVNWQGINPPYTQSGIYGTVNG